MSPTNLVARLREWWQNQTTTRKAGVVAAGALVIATVVLLANIILSPTYAPLFTQLDPAKAGAITKELDSMGVSYKLTNQGSTIEVPENKVHETRVKLANSGVLVGEGKGFELFDTQKFGISDFEQKVAYQRALQEELRRTIVQMDDVDQARVHLVLPEDSVFTENKSNPSASVALKVAAGKELTQEQVKGVVDLVKGSVENMESKDINVVDMQGNILNDSIAQSEGDISGQSTGARQEYVNKFESQLEQELQQMFSRILGPGSVVAMVRAELNFDKVETSETMYGPGQVLSEKNVEEEGTGTGGAQGVPGTDETEGDTDFPGAGEEGGQNEYSRDEDVTNYQLDEYQETIIKSPGDVERLSVALVVDEQALENVEDQDELQQELDSIQNLVASAVGYDPTRGDQITISSRPFDTSLQEEFQEEGPAPEEGEQFPGIDTAVAGIAAGSILFLFLAFLLIRRRRKRRRVEEVQETYEPPAAGGRPPAPEPPPPPEPDKRDDVREKAKEDPEEVAEILKLWLKE